MSKQIYSKAKYFLARDGVPKNYLEKNLDEVLGWYINRCDSMPWPEDEKQNQKTLITDSCISWNQILTGGAIHFFIESKKLFDFLSEQEVKEVDASIDFCEKFVEKPYTQIADIYDTINGEVKLIKQNSEYKNVCIVIHHKYINRPSFVYLIKWFERSGENELGSFYVEDEEGPFRLYTNDIEERKNPLAKLFYNTLFYIEAFPDCIVDGTIEEKHAFDKFYKAKNRMKIATHESLISHDSITPHFRKGYFKRLSSKFYKNKRGQVVFVHSTFVKGKAVTVMDDGITELLEAK